MTPGTTLKRLMPTNERPYHVHKRNIKIAPGYGIPNLLGTISVSTNKICPEAMKRYEKSSLMMKELRKKIDTIVFEAVADQYRPDSCTKPFDKEDLKEIIRRINAKLDDDGLWVREGMLAFEGSSCHNDDVHKIQVNCRSTLKYARDGDIDVKHKTLDIIENICFAIAFFIATVIAIFVVIIVAVLIVVLFETIIKG